MEEKSITRILVQANVRFRSLPFGSFDDMLGKGIEQTNPFLTAGLDGEKMAAELTCPVGYGIIF